jgi:polyhydroxybutyrate depolymerase
MRTFRSLGTAVLAALLLSACGSDLLQPGAFLVGGARPAIVVPPPDFDPTEPAPLIVVLHGYRSNARSIEETFPLATGAAVVGALVVRPEGALDRLNQRFWNAAAACCNLTNLDVKDEDYLLGLIDEIEAQVAVSDVLLFGHSNGGFMTHRLACRHPDRFAAVITIAGALDDPPPPCGVGGPPNVLLIHGTDDSVISYDGGQLFSFPPYTGAEATATAFAAGAGCGAFVAGTPFDFDGKVEGAETVPLEADCPEGRRVVQWRIDGGGHEPRVGADFAARLLRFAEGR